MHFFEVEICFDTGCNLCFRMNNRKDIREIQAFCADCDDVVEVKVTERSISVVSAREIIDYLCGFDDD